MGQLEKYGLYVLCLVIFLILGVAIWGGADAQLQTQRTAELQSVQPDPVVVPMLTGRDPAALVPANVAPAVTTRELLGELSGSALPVTPKGQEPVVVPEVTSTARPTYRVASGDSFERIAKRAGSVRLVRNIVQLNPTLSPTKLSVGAVLNMPTAEEVQAVLGKPAANPAKPAASPTAPTATRTYQVGKGDTLEGIARRELGNPRRVADIQKLNPNVQPRTLKVGRNLVLPTK